MPTTIIRAGATTTSAEGEIRSGPPRESLVLFGPRLEGVITVSDSHQEVLCESAEFSDSSSETGFAMFDTGASVTCFDIEAATRLGLPVIDQGNMISASHSDSPVPIYYGKLTFAGFSFDGLRAMGANLASQELVALIGRDLLQHGTLFYNGCDGSVTFSM